MTRTLAAKGVLWASLVLAFALPGPAGAHIVSRYVVMAGDDGAVLRVVSDTDRCPSARVDGRSVPLALRAASRTYPARPGVPGMGAGKPSEFPVSVCEAPLPGGARQVRLAGRPVRVAPALVRRIVVIGDTGCRLKASANAWQACNAPRRQWPFARIARLAAATHPDLVLHVGDYLYRESACPKSAPGCAGAAWGYGWEGWNADFFRPARPLLDAAPWVMVRGNHEECARAGQGWWLLLDPHALRAGADCGDPAHDFEGNHTEPYAVLLGGGAQLVVGDFAGLGENHLAPAALARYRADAERIRNLTRPGLTSFVAAHYPFYALSVGKAGLQSGFASIADAFEASDRLPCLPNVAAMLAGHIHLLQYVAREGLPVQIVNGFSGTLEEAAEAPSGLSGLQDTPQGAGVRDIVSIAGRFGFGLLERQRDGRWRYTAHDLDGRVLFRRVFPG